MTIAEVLLGIWSRVRIPDKVLTDQGPQLVTKITKEFDRLLSVKYHKSSIYHLISNGLTERFNGTLKQILRKLRVGQPKDWGRYFSALLFAYREVPQASLGFSPFELLYGRTVKGHMAVLKQLWTDDKADTEVRSTYQYIVDLTNRLEEVCKLARENLQAARKRQVFYYNKKTKERNFAVGDKVLALLPLEHNKLAPTWH